MRAIDGNDWIGHYDLQINTFIDNLEGCMTGVPEFGDGYIHSLNNEFVDYDIATRNCFRATAIWCQWLGYDKLMEIYEARKSNYRNYLPNALYNIYKDYWIYQGAYR